MALVYFFCLFFRRIAIAFKIEGKLKGTCN